MTEVRDLAAKIFGRTLGRAIYVLIKADWNKYGLEAITGDSLAEKLVVPIKNTSQNVFAAFLFWSAPIYIGADQNGESARRAEKGKSALMLRQGRH